MFSPEKHYAIFSILILKDPDNLNMSYSTDFLNKCAFKKSDVEGEGETHTHTQTERDAY